MQVASTLAHRMLRRSTLCIFGAVYRELERLRPLWGRTGLRPAAVDELIGAVVVFFFAAIDTHRPLRDEVYTLPMRAHSAELLSVRRPLPM